MNNYAKFLADLVDMDVEMEEDDKTVILLNSLPDEKYETFVLTLINGKQTFNYSDVSAALVNYKVRKKNKQSSSKSDSTEAGVSIRRAKAIVGDQSSDRVSEN